jgi:hypothetical protein
MSLVTVPSQKISVVLNFTWMQLYGSGFINIKLLIVKLVFSENVRGGKNAAIAWP